MILLSTTPENGAKSVPIDQIISIKFDREIVLGSGDISIKVLGSSPSPEIISRDSLEVSGDTLNIIHNLSYNNIFTISLANNSVLDKETNEGIEAFNFTFTTVKEIDIDDVDNHENEDTSDNNINSDNTAPDNDETKPSLSDREMTLLLALSLLLGKEDNTLSQKDKEKAFQEYSVNSLGKRYPTELIMDKLIKQKRG